MSVHTSGYVAQWYQSGAWVTITQYVISVDASFATQNSGSGLGFGDSSSAEFSLLVDPHAGGGSLSLSTLALVPVRVQFTLDSGTAYGCAGVVLSWEQTADSISLKCTGFRELIRTIRAYSPLWQNRPVATKTSATSIEDPANGAWAAGALNWLLFSAGGRPLLQAGAGVGPGGGYPNATFYYDLSQAPIAPAWTWIAGEDSWAEAIRLVRAVGGQLYQAPSGTVIYRSPLSVAGGTSLFTLDSSKYTEISRNGSAEDVVSSFTTTYLPRVVAGMQEVVSDTTPRVVASGASVVIELEPQYPLTGIETDSTGTQLRPEALSIVAYDGTPVAQLVSGGYAHSFTLSAQRITILIVSTMTMPFVIEKITIRGTPVVPTEAGTMTIGSGNPTQTIEQSAYIQSRSHAQRLARMALAFYGTPRPIIQARGCLYDPVNHQIGNAGTLTQNDWGLSSAPVVILGVSVGDTGVSADLDLVETTGLPKLADYFIIGPTNYSSLSRKIGY